MNIDERLEALTMNLELTHRDVESLRGTVERLVTVTEELVGSGRAHEHRTERLEDR